MARCANCGREIPDEDKTRLCDECKRVILPFIKFMEGSDTPAVKRLLSNERNLRSAGVTDTGMDYLYRICTLHDKKWQSAQEAKANSSTAAAFGTPDAGESGGGKKITAANLPAPQFGDSAPVRKPPKTQKTQKTVKTAEPEEESSLPDEGQSEETVVPFGRALPAAKWIMILAGTASLIWFAAKILTREFAGESLTDSIDAGALCAALSSYAGAYIASAVRKAIRKLEEQRKE